MIEIENVVIIRLGHHHRGRRPRGGNLLMILEKTALAATTTLTGTSVLEERGDGSRTEGHRIAGMTGLG